MYPFEAENYILWKKNSPSFEEKIHVIYRNMTYKKYLLKYLLQKINNSS